MFEPIRRWPAFIKIFIGVAFMGAIVALVYAKVVMKGTPEEQLAAGVARYEQCFQNHDSRCLFEFATDSEKKELGLDEAKFVAFADKMVWPNFGTLTRNGEPKTLYSQSGGGANAANSTNRVMFQERKVDGPPDQVSMIQRYKRQDGKTTQLQFEMIMTKSGVKSPNLVGSLYLDSIFAFAPKAKVRSWARFPYYAEQTRKLKPELEKLGVKGYVADARNVKSGDPITWDQWTAYWDKTVKTEDSRKLPQTTLNPRGMPGR